MAHSMYVSGVLGAYNVDNPDYMYIKIVSSEKVIEEYGYQFKVPHLMNWLLQTPQN